MIRKLSEAFFIIASVAVIFELAIMWHELGHLVMGKLIGYRFVSYRIGPFALVRDGQRLRIVKQGGIAGTGGQCVMCPPDVKEPEKLPAVPYHLGGGLFNLLAALVCLPLCFFAVSTYPKAFLLLSGAINLGLGIHNLFPIKLAFPNDGYNIKLISKSVADRLSIYNTLRVLGHPELSPAEMPEEYFTTRNEGEYAPVSHMMRRYHLLDRRQYQEAEEEFVLCSSDEKVTDFYRLESAALVFLCRIMRNAGAQSVEEVYDEQLQQYIESTKKTLPDKRCVLFAYKLLCRGDESAAEAEYAELKKLCERSANSGDARMWSGIAEEARRLHADKA